MDNQHKTPSLRSAVAEYVKAAGSSAVAAYLPGQDLLFLTDFNSVLVLTPASKYVRGFKLTAVTEYGRRWRELPGAHILDEDNEDDSTDTRNRSIVSDRSLDAMSALSLAETQLAAGIDTRLPLRLRHEKSDPGTVGLTDYAGLNVVVGEGYYDSLLGCDLVRKFSGVVDPFKEPTVSWRELPVENKGVFFTAANNTFYGLVMPHAKANAASR